ncbi:MAG: HD domain-containing protein [Candidatus Pacebacteria bacterium]|nr:HD domain-containing protein [Candidatus Paceibacterota bacterium]
MPPDLKFIIDLTHKYRAIDRDMYYPNSNKAENDAEHTFQLVLVAWHIIETNKIPLNQEKVFKLCLSHDLVEIHSGDVPLWGSSSKSHDEKSEREQKALLKLKEDFSPNTEIVSSIEEYKARTSDEAKFVYALDKLIPYTNQVFIEGKVWKNHGVTLQQVVDIHLKHALVSPYLSQYFYTIVDLLKKDPERYFGRN